MNFFNPGRSSELELELCEDPRERRFGDEDGFDVGCACSARMIS